MMAVMDKRSRAKNHQHSTRSILLSQHATYKFISTQFRLQFNFVVYGLSKTWPRFYFKPIPPRITYLQTPSIIQLLHPSNIGTPKKSLSLPSPGVVE